MTAFGAVLGLSSQALFFDLMAVKADQHCSTSLLPQCGQPWSTRRTLLWSCRSTGRFPQLAASLPHCPARNLVKHGYPVTIYEAASKPGGQLMWTIPQYRLPKEVVAADVKDIIDLGIDLKLNTPI